MANELFDSYGRPVHINGPGAERIGTVSGVLKVVSDTKTLVADGDYAANDVMSESKTAGTCYTFDAIARANGGGGYITKARVVYSRAAGVTAITPRIALFLFKAVPTSVLNDNAANTALLAADKDNYLGMIVFPALSSYGSTTACTAKKVPDGVDLPMAFECAANDDAIYGIAVILDTEANETAGAALDFKLTAEQY
jgi:hypothetical protein